MKRLSQTVQTQLDQLIEQGNNFSDQEQHLEALNAFSQALDLFPEPWEKRSEIMWLLTSIGDSLFHLGSYEKTILAFSDAIRMGGLGNPFIHLRLGQSQFELGNEAKAADELARAYMGAGEEIFQDQPTRYFEFLKTKIKMPDGNPPGLL